MQVINDETVSEPASKRRKLRRIAETNDGSSDEDGAIIKGKIKRHHQAFKSRSYQLTDDVQLVGNGGLRLAVSGSLLAHISSFFRENMYGKGNQFFVYRSDVVVQWLGTYMTRLLYHIQSLNRCGSATNLHHWVAFHLLPVEATTLDVVELFIFAAAWDIQALQIGAERFLLERVQRLQRLMQDSDPMTPIQSLQSLQGKCEETLELCAPLYAESIRLSRCAREYYHSHTSAVTQIGAKALERSEWKFLTHSLRVSQVLVATDSALPPSPALPAIPPHSISPISATHTSLERMVPMRWRETNTIRMISNDDTVLVISRSGLEAISGKWAKMTSDSAPSALYLPVSGATTQLFMQFLCVCEEYPTEQGSDIIGSVIPEPCDFHTLEELLQIALTEDIPSLTKICEQRLSKHLDFNEKNLFMCTSLYTQSPALQKMAIRYLARHQDILESILRKPMQAIRMEHMARWMTVTADEAEK